MTVLGRVADEVAVRVLVAVSAAVACGVPAGNSQHLQDQSRLSCSAAQGAPSVALLGRPNNEAKQLLRLWWR